MGMQQIDVEKVYRENRGLLLQHAKSIVRSDADAEDVLQTAFVNALRAAHKFEGRSQPTTWLYRITHNAALMHLRSKRRKGAESLDALPGELKEVVVARSRPSSGYEPEQNLDQRQLGDRLEKALGTLPELDRVIIERRLWQERSTQDVAASTGLSVSATKARVRRSRARLQHLLAEPQLAAA